MAPLLQDIRCHQTLKLDRQLALFFHTEALLKIICRFYVRQPLPNQAEALH